MIVRGRLRRCPMNGSNSSILTPSVALVTAAVLLLVYFYFCTRLFLTTAHLTLSPSVADEHFHVNRSSLHSAGSSSRLLVAQSYNMHASTQKVFRCPQSNGPKRPTHIRWNNGHWQNPECTNLFVYSAFYDRRMKATYRDGHCFVRALVMHDDHGRSTPADGSTSTTYFCHIWIGTGTINDTGPAIVVEAEMREIWHPEWDADSRLSILRPFLLSCILPRKHEKLARRRQIGSTMFLSLSDKPCTSTSTYVDVQHFDMDDVQRTKKDFVVCVKPMDFAHDFSRKLVEWVELNLALGVDKINVYQFRVHPNVERVLRFYADAGLLDVTPMTLAASQPNFPVERSAFLRRNLWAKRRSELLPYNDCYYRNLYKYRYVIPLDIDELIVPREQGNLRQLMAHLESNMSDVLRTYASFSVRNAYFLDAFSTSSAVQDESYFLEHTVRSANFSMGGRSTKSLVRTDAALTVFNHYVLDSLLPGVGRSTEIPVGLVQMNHYRSNCPDFLSDECKNNFLKHTLIDTVLWKYKDLVLAKLRQVYTHLGI